MLTIALFGNSLVMSSIGASLQNRAGVRLLLVDAALPSPAQQLDTDDPDVVIFDLATIQPDRVVALLESHPRLLVGIDLAANKALVLSGISTRVWTPDDLVQLIESRTLGGTIKKPGIDYECRNTPESRQL